MIRSSLLLGLAAAAFVAGVGARALPPAEQVNDALIQSKKLPRTLGDFGFFRDPSARAPSESLIPYELNTPLYSDGADKLRFIYLPEGEAMTANGEGLLQFPVGTAIIKTFAFGEGDDQRYIETRVLLNRADGWLALPYRWNDEQTEAKLAVAGARIPITTPSGEEISYRIPNKNQCKTWEPLPTTTTRPLTSSCHSGPNIAPIRSRSKTVIAQRHIRKSSSRRAKSSRF